MNNNYAAKPVLFSGPMVKALVAGRKTQTRRIIKPQPMADGYYEGQLRMERVHHPDGADPDCYARFSADAVGGGAFVEKTIKMPYSIGDRLWVREAWHAAHGADAISPKDMDASWMVCPAVDWNYVDWGIKGRLRASIHMPRWASRLTLIVTDVRVQRLQELTEADAQAEGIMQVGPGLFDYHEHAEIRFKTAKAAMHELWDGLNAKRGPYDWDANPWVVALTFEVHRVNIDLIESKL